MRPRKRRLTPPAGSPILSQRETVGCPLPSPPTMHPRVILSTSPSDRRRIGVPGQRGGWGGKNPRIIPTAKRIGSSPTQSPPFPRPPSPKPESTHIHRRFSRLTSHPEAGKLSASFPIYACRLQTSHRSRRRPRGRRRVRRVPNLRRGLRLRRIRRHPQRGRPRSGCHPSCRGRRAGLINPAPTHLLPRSRPSSATRSTHSAPPKAEPAPQSTAPAPAG